MTTSTNTARDLQTHESEAQSSGRLTRGTLLGLGGYAVVLAVGLAVPYVVTDTYNMGLLVEIAILSLLTMSIGFLARHLGLISLGHTAFFGGAAYAMGILATHYDWDPALAVLGAVGFGAVLALLMGILVVRSSGMGFLMLTLAFSAALYQLCVLTSARPLTGAYDGLLISLPAKSTFFGLTASDVHNPGLFWPFAWVALVVSTLALWLLGRFRFGTILEGIRENEERMRFSGYNTYIPRVAAFTASGTVASLGGALFALNAGYVSPDVLGFGRAGDALIATLIGGIGTLLGPVVGAGLFVYAQARFNIGGNLPLFTGVALIVVLVFFPGGVTGGLRVLVRRVRAWRGKRALPPTEAQAAERPDAEESP